MGLLKRTKPQQQVQHQVVDLTEAPPPPPPPPRPRFGLPTSCPECGEPGYLDHIDPYREIMYQHCPSCWTKWELSRAELDSPATA
jgi:hypothetical protein